MAVNMTEQEKARIKELAVHLRACGRHIERDAEKFLTMFSWETGLKIEIKVVPDELVTMRVITDGIPDEQDYEKEYQH